MPYRLGELNQRVTIKRVTLARDGAGGAAETWTAITNGTVWAHVRPLSGGERTEAMRTEGRSQYLVVIRYRGDIKERDRIEWNGRQLNVRFPRYRGTRGAFLEIEAELGAIS